MYVINKIVGAVTNPLCTGLIVLAVVLLASVFRRGRPLRLLALVALAWLYFWSMPVTMRLVGVPLESPYLEHGRVRDLASYPAADAIELHGGAMTHDVKLGDVAEMSGSADRVWMAARLWKAGKAPKIFVTGVGSTESSAGLLKDFGVPTNALVFAEAPRNTEEEARFIAEATKQVKVEGVGVQRMKVLVVTSAWHMKRTMLMYAKYAPNVEAIPAPCDFEISMKCLGPICAAEFLPDHFALALNCVALHEWVGIWGYKLFR